MNGEDAVSGETRSNVLRAVERLGYAPNMAARSLASGAVKTLGLVHSNPSSAYLSQILVGALDAARTLGCHLVIEPCEADRPEEQVGVVRRLAAGGIEGLILPPPLSESRTILDELALMQIPAATIATNPRGGNALDVRIDDFRAALEMTAYLLRLGHRRIGFIKGHPNQVASHERLHGFAAALATVGLNAERLPMAQGYFTYRSGLAAAEILLNDSEPPTAIFASNDDMAAAVLSVAHRRGITVPQDLTVVGFDDTSLATTVWPELTTVRQPIAKMAQVAIELLLERVRASRGARAHSPRERILEHALVFRESSGRAKSGDKN
jgi:LacI family transcriptional regulator